MERNMPYKIIEIIDNTKKQEYTDNILKKLPEWFGNINSLQNYINTVKNYPFWAAFYENICVGIFSCKITSVQYKNFSKNYWFLMILLSVFNYKVGHYDAQGRK